MTTIELFLLLLITTLTQATTEETTTFNIDEFDRYSDDLLTIKFSEPMQRADPQTIPITLSPPVDCYWSWIDHKHLSCSLNDYSDIDEDDIDDSKSKTFKLATRYTLQLRSGLVDINDNPIIPQTKSFVYSRPQATKFNIVHWLEPSLPIISIGFNQQIHFSSLNHKMFLVSETDRIALNEAELNETLKNTINSYGNYRQTQRYHQPVRPLQENQNYYLHIDQGVKGLIGEITSEKYISKNAMNALRDFQILKHQCYAPNQWKPHEEPCYADDSIEIHFSSFIDQKSFYNCQHQSKYSWHYREFKPYQSSLHLTPKSQELKTQHINLLADCIDSLKDQFGRSITSKQNSKEIITQGFRPSLSLKPYQSLLGLNEETDLKITTINLDKYTLFVEEVNHKKVNQKYTISLDQTANELTSSSVPLQRFHQDFQFIKGYLSFVDENNSTEDNTDKIIPFLIQKSPYHINFKYNVNHAAIQINDMNSTQPIKNQSFTLTHDKKKYHGVTDNNGFAQVSLLGLITEDQFSGFDIFIAENQQLHFPPIKLVKINQFNIDIERKDNESNHYGVSENNFTTYGVTDKPVYRPGETVKYKFFVRQKKDNHFIIPQLDLTFKTYINYIDADCWYEYDECHSFYVKEVKQLDQFGGFADQFTLPQSINNGSYSIGIIIKGIKRWSNNEQDTNLQFKVSHFKDSTYKLNLTASITNVKGQQVIPLTATAEYYSGGFVAHEPGEIAGEINGIEITDSFPEFESYQFKPQEERYSDNQFLKYLTYNENGIINAEYTVEENDIEFGQIKLNAGIKPKNGEWNYGPDLLLPYRQKDYFVGLKFDQWYKSTNDDITLKHVFITHQGNIVKPESIIYKIKHRNNNQKWSDSTPLNCKKRKKDSCVLSLTQAGQYDIEASFSFDDQQYNNNINFQVYDQHVINNNNSNNKNENTISIIADKETYNLGDTARITINLPNEKAQALLTTERNRVLNSWVKSTTTGKITHKFTIRPEHVPGFDVSVLLQPSVSNDLFTRLNQRLKQKKQQYSSLSVKVNGKKNDKPFTIKTSKKSYKPKEPVTLKITNDFTSTSNFVIAVVDQSVVDLVDKKYLYNLDEFAYQKAKYQWQLMQTNQVRRKKNSQNTIRLYHHSAPMSIYSHDYYDDDNNYETDTEELDSIRVTGSNITRVDLGAYLNEVNGRPLPITTLNRETQKIQPVNLSALNITAQDLRSYFAESAFFTTDVVIDPNTSKKISFNLPDNTTQWRIIVLGTDLTGTMAFQQSSIKASKDLELRSTLPLQLTDGDQFSAEYTVVSKTNKKTTIETAAQAIQNDIVIANIDQKFKAVKKFESQSLSLPIDAITESDLQLMAIAKTTKNADGLLNNIPVRKAEIQWSTSQFGQSDASKIIVDFNSPSTEKTQGELSVTVSNNLLSNLQGAYDYITDYPHQCWEQQSAKAIISAIELDSQSSWNTTQIEQAQNSIDNIIKKAQDFQAANGGMTLFGGNNANVNLFLSFYTLENFNFLKSLGYDIPQSVYDRLIKFIEEAQQDTDYLDNNIARLNNDRLSPELELMAINVNIDNNQEYNQKIIDELFEQRILLSLSALNQLIQVYQNNPLKIKQLETLIDDKFYHQKNKYVAKNNDKSYWFTMPSAIKDHCHLISQQLQLDEKLIDKDKMIKHINGILQSKNQAGHFGSTLENTYCSKALYQFAKKYESQQKQHNHTITINNNIHDLTDGEFRQTVQLDQLQSIEINNPEQQQSYYMAKLQYPLDAQDIKPQANGFNIQRQYYIFTEGKWQESVNFKTGDWVKTLITIYSPISRKFVAVSNPVPGGWLPTDSNLASNMPVGIRSSEKPQDNSTAFYERQLNPATTRFYADYLPAGTHHISYYSQVRNAGTYLAMPAVVEEMYDDDNRASTTSTNMVIGKN